MRIKPCFYEDIEDRREVPWLLEHPHFLLLYVPDNGHTKMKLVNPASDSYHRERIMAKMEKRTKRTQWVPLPHYALSHLWGITVTNKHLWDNIGDYVDDEKGQPAAPVSMRPEKRDTLLKLLRHHPDSYWWIDVLCARTDTPLDIMGDIYSWCTECIAMIDCDPDIIPQVHSSMGQLRDTTTLEDDRQREPFWKASEMLDILAQCHWWKRVWTWQEMVLPETVTLVSERTLQLSTAHTLDIDDLETFPMKLDDNARRFGVYDDWNPHPDGVCLEEIGVSRMMKRHFGDPEVEALAIRSMVKTFGVSNRRCMDPADYVYGVLGVLRMYVPRKTDPDEVWKLFLERLSSYISISNHAKRFDLATARNMADVYGILKE